MPEEVARNLYAVAPKLQMQLKQRFQPIGLNTINNNGAALDKLFSTTTYILFRVTMKRRARLNLANTKVLTRAVVRSSRKY